MLWVIEVIYVKGILQHKLKLLLITQSIIVILYVLKLCFFLDPTKTSTTIMNIILSGISLFSIILIIVPKYSLRSIIYKYMDIIILLFSVFYAEIIFMIDNQLQFTPTTLFSLLLMLSVIGLIALLLRTKAKRIFLIVFSIYFTIYLIVQDIYYYTFHDFFSYREVVSLGAGLEFIEGAVRIEFLHIILVLLAILTIILVQLNNRENQIKLTKKTISLLLIPIYIFVLVNINAEYPTKTNYTYKSDHYLYYSRYSNTKFVSRFGAIHYSIRDFFDSIIPKGPNKKELRDIETFYNNNPRNHYINEFTGLFKDKNLVFVMAESFDRIALHEELTPNLIRLRDEGIDFTNFYVPVYPRTTSDSELIFNTSIIPSITDGPTCYFFSKNTFSYSMANIFKDQGYLTQAFHSNRKEFYNRHILFQGLGYEYYYGQKELSLPDELKRYDSVFFEYAKEIMLPTDTKFFSFVTTLSGHSPYDERNEASAKHISKVEAILGDDLPEEIKYFIASQIEVDFFIGELFNALEEKGLLENTVIIFTGDHYPYTITENVFENYIGLYEEYQKNHMPLFIWSKDLDPIKIDKLASSFDILPTVANLFDLDTDYRYYFGKDIFDPFNDKPVVFYKDYSWYDGDNYVKDGVKIFGSGSDDYIQQRNLEIFAYYDISIKLLRNDYFKLLDKKSK